jgi:hypothetical protein
VAKPIIQKTGGVSGPSGAGQGSNDLVAGETVSLANLEPTHAIAAHFWEFVDTPLDTTPVLLNPTTATPSFVVDPDPKLSGSYEIKCTIDGVEYSTEIFAKPLTYSGGRIPAHKEQDQYDESGNLKGWHEAETIFKRSIDELIGASQTSVVNLQAGVSVAPGNSTKEVDIGGAIYPGSALAISGKLDEAVTAGTVTLNLKINGGIIFSAILSTGMPTFVAQIESAGAFPVSSADIITVEIVAAAYVNAAAAASGLAITVALSNSLTNSPLTVPDSSVTVKGISKMSVAPATANNPIAVGTNDPRNSDARTPTAHTHTESEISDLTHTAPGGAGTDTTAIHDNVAGEIAAIANKAAPVAGDRAIIEDSEAGNAKKSVLLSTLGGAPTNPLIIATGDGTSAGATEASIVSGDTSQTAGTATVSSDEQGFCSGTAICSIVGGNAEVVNYSTGGFAAGWAANGTGAGSASVRAFGTGGFAMGWAYNRGVGGQAEVESNGNGGFAVGYAYCNASGVGFAKVYAYGYGSFANGQAWVNGTARARIMAIGKGSHAHGRIYSQGTSQAYIRAHSAGSHAGGMVRTKTSGECYIRAGYGCFAHGYVYGNADNGHIYIYGHGSWAGGFSDNGGEITVYNDGALAFGVADGARIIAHREGNFAMGVTFGNDIEATGFGCFVHGWANTGVIDATGDNAQQFGPGVNAEDDTMKIGVAGIRFKGTDGAPGSPVNGDFWMDGVNAFLKTNGVNGKIATLDAIQAYTKQQHPTPLVLTDAANIALAATARNAYTLLATGGVGATREIDNASVVLAGMSWTIAFTNDTGARDLTFGANYSWGDETPTVFTGQAAGEITLLTFFALSPTKVVITALTGH